MKVPRPPTGVHTTAGATPLTLDFSGGLHTGSPEARWLNPTCAEEVAQAIRDARADGVALRFRGHGHSMNGASLPRAGERVLSSERLCGFRFDAPGTITVGGGALMWDIHSMLRQRGYELLVANDGAAPAPSVGGFVAAGGIGENTHTHGGFWETVQALTVVTGAGDILTLRREDELFRWMFGAMGQLAFVVEATLRILPLGKGVPYPADEQGELPRTPAQWERYAWFTLFVPFAKAQQALNQLGEVAARHPGCWRPLSSYVYPIRFFRFNPSLLYPNQRGFVAVGIWGTPTNPAAGFDFHAVKQLDADVTALVRANPDYRRYIQSEMTFGEVDYQAFFGEETFEAFRALKLRYDPDSVLGRGQVFR